MTALEGALLTGFIAATGMVALSFAAMAALRRKVSARSEYAAWIVLAALILLTPLRPAPAKPVVTLDSAHIDRVLASPVVRTQRVNAADALMGIWEDDMPGATNIHAAALNTANEPARQAPRPALRVGDIAVMAYIIGCAANAALILLRHIRFTRTVRRWKTPVTDPGTLAIFQAEKKRLGIKKRVSLCRCRAVDGPTLLGFIRPTVLLPDSILPTAALSLVLRHELTHCKRGDILIKWMQALCLCAHWYNPLIRLMNARMNLACEAACDEYVTRGADITLRQCYSQTILAVIRAKNSPRPALSTSFYGGKHYGGKKGMKKRIDIIMNPSVRRLGALLVCLVLALCLALPGAVATQGTQDGASGAALPEGGKIDTLTALSPDGLELPYEAEILSPVSKGANLCNMTTSYDYSPQGVYLNCTPVTVLKLREMINNVPGLAQGERVYWAQVAIGRTDSSEGVVGFIPLPCIVTDGDKQDNRIAPAMAQIMSSETAGVSLYASNDTQSAVLTTLPAGSQVRVLGRLRDFWHIQADGGVKGFVAVDALALSGAAQALFAPLLPERYDYVQPGQQERFEAYQAAIDALWDEYGDSNDWPLDIRAQATQLKLDSGFYWRDSIEMFNVMPGEGELTPEQAGAIADKLAEELYGMTTDTCRKRSMFYYYHLDDPDARIWSFRYYATPGHYACAIRLNKAGELLSQWQDDMVQRPIEPDNLMPTLTSGGVDQTASSIEPYCNGIQIRPTEGEEAMRESVSARAMALFEETAGGDKPLDGCDVMLYFYRNTENTLRWWLATVTYTAQAGGNTTETYLFRAAFVLGEAPYVVTSTREEFLDQMRSMQETLRYWEYIAAHGPSYGWSLELKAQAFPNWCTLPGEGDIPQEQALQIAQDYLRVAYGFDDDAIAAWKPFFFFTIEHLYTDLDGPAIPRRCWRVDFYTEEALRQDSLYGYTVFVDPVTGEVLTSWEPGGNG